jgi:hypothetical protein
LQGLHTSPARVQLIHCGAQQHVFSSCRVGHEPAAVERLNPGGLDFQLAFADASSVGQDRLFGAGVAAWCEVVQLHLPAWGSSGILCVCFVVLQCVSPNLAACIATKLAAAQPSL